MIVVLADDLTGASELAGVGWRSGLESEVVPLESGLRRAALTCVDLNSRLENEAEAAGRVRRALAALEGRGVEWVYKKMDSVLRGHVVAEVAEVMRCRGAKRAIVVSANPSLGRTVREGVYSVRGVPLAETDFRFDPQYPRWTSRVAELLGGGRLPVHVLKPGSRLPAEGLIVGEAASREDLDWWARECDPTTVTAGAAEFFAALLEARGVKVPEVLPRILAPQPGERTLFVCGSASRSASDFLSRCRAGGMLVLGIPPEAMQESWSDEGALAKRVQANLESVGRGVLAIDLPLSSQAGVGDRLLGILVDVAGKVLRGSDPGNPMLVCVEGGATAAALWARAGWGPLRVEAELAQGVVVLRPVLGGNLRVAMKPGSYVWPIPSPGKDPGSPPSAVSKATGIIS
jgi:uncharacterized protein YgbK (DUF1537 family)